MRLEIPRNTHNRFEIGEIPLISTFRPFPEMTKFGTFFISQNGWNGESSYFAKWQNWHKWRNFVFCKIAQWRNGKKCWNQQCFPWKMLAKFRDWKSEWKSISWRAQACTALTCENNFMWIKIHPDFLPYIILIEYLKLKLFLPWQNTFLAYLFLCSVNSNVRRLKRLLQVSMCFCIISCSVHSWALKDIC